MMISKLKSVILSAVVVNFTHDGSCIIDPDLMEAANIQEYEQVHIYKVDTGNWVTTYVTCGIGCGLAIPQGMIDDDFPGGVVNICTYININSETDHTPTRVFVDSENTPLGDFQ